LATKSLKNPNFSRAIKAQKTLHAYKPVFTERNAHNVKWSHSNLGTAKFMFITMLGMLRIRSFGWNMMAEVASYIQVWR
jgi:hypothetical protein